MFWLKNRKKTIFLTFIDLSIISIIYLYQKDYNFFIPSIFWILISYVCGRYSIKCDRNFFISTKDILSRLIINLFFILMICGVIRYLLSFFSINLYDLEGFMLFNLRLSTLSIFSQLLFISFYKSAGIEKKYFLIIGENIFKKFNFLDNELDKFRNLKIISFEEIDLETEYDFLGIIINKKILSDTEIDLCKDNEFKGKSTINLLEWFEKYLNRIPSEFISNSDLYIFNRTPNYKFFQMRLKRVGDIIVSLSLLFFLLPIMILVMCIIKIQDGGPIFYSQLRTGFRGKPFKVWKFRSMKINAEENGPQWSKKEDNRVTSFGKILRKSRIDELPQLINVMIGDMSLIGPRPERPEIDKKIEKEINSYNKRYLIRPGLSGWAQVNYPYGASINDAKYKLSFDLFYIQNFSFLLDFIILFKTIKLVLNLNGSKPK